jgi:four helix bundle protein
MVCSYRELIVWQKAMELVVAVYKLAGDYPKEETYGLTSQTKRSVVSISSNIAEGRYRGSRKDFANFLRIAYASGAELETQIEIAKRLFENNKLNFSEVDKLLEEVMKMLNKMINTLTS